MIHGHGSDGYKYKGGILADFSSNVWYEGTPPELQQHLQNEVSNLGHYPEPDSGKLKQAIAELHSLNAENVLATNGSAEAIYLIARGLKKSQSVIFTPSFAEYEDACVREGHHCLYAERHKMADEIAKPDCQFWICNPNNPDGQVIAKDVIESYLKANPTSLFVIDEAYVDLCTVDCSSVDLINKYKNLIILKSFTKAYTIPGIRLGYVLASGPIISRLNEFMIPWNVNSLAMEAGIRICENHQNWCPDKGVIDEEMQVFVQQLQSTDLIDTVGTNSNYVSGKLRCGSAASLKEFLAVNFKLLIRDASNFRGLGDRHIRLALQSPENNQLLIGALNKYKSQVL